MIFGVVLYPSDLILYTYFYMHHFHKRKIPGDYVRSSIFGIEDSLVSTTGLIAGVAASGADKRFVIVAGLVAVAVEAISMGAGEFISEDTEHNLDKGKDSGSPIVGGIIMFLSYIAAGMVPLLPIIFFPEQYAMVVSIVAAAIGLFVLGLVKGRATRRSSLRNGLQVLIVGGIAAAIGIAVGLVFKM